MVREDADQRYGTADKSRVWMMQGRQSERNVVYNTQTKEMGGEGPSTASEIYFGEDVRQSFF